jgi:hypothetical protein
MLNIITQFENKEINSENNFRKFEIIYFILIGIIKI